MSPTCRRVSDFVSDFVSGFGFDFDFGSVLSKGYYGMGFWQKLQSSMVATLVQVLTCNYKVKISYSQQINNNQIIILMKHLHLGNQEILLNKKY